MRLDGLGFCELIQRMRIQLSFMGEGASLRLFHAQVSEKSNTSDIWDSLSAPSSGQPTIFQWRPAVCGLCILLLEAFVRGKPYAAKIRGERRSSAASLAELLGDKSAKGNSDLKTWVQHLFSPLIQPKGADPRVPRNVLLPKVNSSHGDFSVELGARWQEAEIIIELDSKEVDEARARKLLDALATQALHKRGKALVPRLTAQIDLWVWDTKRCALVAAEEAGLPLPVSFGVALRIHLSQPAYAYVVWINSQNTVQPLHPWNDFEWTSCPPCSPRTDLFLPSSGWQEATSYYPINSRPGIETALVLAERRRYRATRYSS